MKQIPDDDVMANESVKMVQRTALQLVVAAVLFPFRSDTHTHIYIYIYIHNYISDHCFGCKPGRS